MGGNRDTISAAEYFAIASGRRHRTSTHSGLINPLRWRLRIHSLKAVVLCLFRVSDGFDNSQLGTAGHTCDQPQDYADLTHKGVICGLRLELVRKAAKGGGEGTAVPVRDC
jgi:hypothetical protein